MSKQLNALIVDSNEDMCQIIADAARAQGFNCITTNRAADFIAELNDSIDLIILSLLIPDMDGVEVIRLLAHQQCKIKINIISSMDLLVLENVHKLGISLQLNMGEILQKPFHIIALENMLIKAASELKQPMDKLVKIAKLQSNAVNIKKKDLVQALENDEFIVYYQPQIYLPDNSIAGFEALVRWQHPTNGLTFPDSFIRYAELYGVIESLTWVVINKSLQAYNVLAAKIPHSFTVSINISPYVLHDLTFPDKLLDACKRYDIKPNTIIIEITESGLIRDITSALDILSRLRIKQFQLSIDDFGTGYAMLEQVRRVPATELKIDKSLVNDINVQESAHIMIKNIIELSHNLKLRAIAEGVETEQQLQFLKSNKCDYAQGYLFSKALAMPDLLSWISNFSSIPVLHH